MKTHMRDLGIYAIGDSHWSVGEAVRPPIPTVKICSYHLEVPVGDSHVEIYCNPTKGETALSTYLETLSWYWLGISHVGSALDGITKAIERGRIIYTGTPAVFLRRGLQQAYIVALPDGNRTFPFDRKDTFTQASRLASHKLECPELKRFIGY